MTKGENEQLIILNERMGTALKGLDAIEAHLKELNGTVAKHETRLQLLEKGTEAKSNISVARITTFGVIGVGLISTIGGIVALILQSVF